MYRSLPLLAMSGKRFSVAYRLHGLPGPREARTRAHEIALEQTVELSDDLLEPGLIRHQVVGRVEALEAASIGVFDVVISYPIEAMGGEFPQFLNVLFGNSSIKPDIRVEYVALPECLFSCFKGPRFGVQGLRDRLQVKNRPLLCAALKPMGLSAEELAERAFQFALGGIDLIKDDHGLADQPFARFEDRISRCVEAVEKANRQTGRRAMYLANVSLPIATLWERLRFAKRAGVGGFLVSPGLIGLETMRQIAHDDSLGLPLLMHPALLGPYVLGARQGLSHYVLFGQLARLIGADGSIFPSYGGRFSFTQEECGQIARGCRDPMGPFRPIFPVAGGGLGLNNIPDIVRFYGRDTILLVGGGLYRQQTDLISSARYLHELVSA